MKLRPWVVLIPWSHYVLFTNKDLKKCECVEKICRSQSDFSHVLQVHRNGVFSPVKKFTAFYECTFHFAHPPEVYAKEMQILHAQKVEILCSKTEISAVRKYTFSTQTLQWRCRQTAQHSATTKQKLYTHKLKFSPYHEKSELSNIFHTKLSNCALPHSSRSSTLNSTIVEQQNPRGWILPKINSELKVFSQNLLSGRTCAIKVYCLPS